MSAEHIKLPNTLKETAAIGLGRKSLSIIESVAGCDSLPAHMKIGQFDPRDKKFWGPPEPGFSPEKNKRVIENSIRKYERMRARKIKNFTDKLRERTDAAATFLKSRFVDSNSPQRIEKYFGKQYFVELRAEDIRNKLIEQRLRMVGGGRQSMFIEKQKIKETLSKAPIIKIKRTKSNGEKE